MKMRNIVGNMIIFMVLMTPLDGQVPRELRNPTPKEIIAQLLLRRAQKGNLTPGPVFRQTEAKKEDEESDGGGGGGDGGDAGAGGEGGGGGSGGSSGSGGSRSVGGGGGGGSAGGGGGPGGGLGLLARRAFQSPRPELNHLTKSVAPEEEACTGATCGPNEEFRDRWSMPLMKLGDKRYYLGIFFKANWYKAAQYCRFHGMLLAGVETERQNRFLEQHIQDAGLGHEHFWTSGTDQGEEGRFFWMSNGHPITFTNWNAGEPNNFQYENGEMEHCLELWNRDGKGLKWNDSPCSFETFFICEVE